MTGANMGMHEDATLVLSFFTFTSFQMLHVSGRYAVNLAFVCVCFRKPLWCVPHEFLLLNVSYFCLKEQTFLNIFSIVPLLTYTVYVDNTNEVFLQGFRNRLSYHVIIGVTFALLLKMCHIDKVNKLAILLVLTTTSAEISERLLVNDPQTMRADIQHLQNQVTALLTRNAQTEKEMADLIRKNNQTEKEMAALVAKKQSAWKGLDVGNNVFEE